MIDLAHDPTFQAYAAACIVLGLNLLVVWAYSGAARAKTKIVINPEDAKGAGHQELDPPAVARVLRAHANAQAAIVPFFALGLVFVLARGSVTFARVDFGIFVAARVIHSLVYLAGKQPWRTIAFAIAGLATLALIVDDGLLVFSS